MRRLTGLLALLLLDQCRGVAMEPEADPADAAVVSGAADGNRDRLDAARTANDGHPSAQDATVDRRRVDKAQIPDAQFPKVTCADDLLFCEDFEVGAVDPARWDTELAGDGAISFDTTRFAAGRRSLHIKVKQRTPLAGAALVTRQRFAVGDRNLNIRIFYYTDKLTPVGFIPVIMAWDDKKKLGFALNTLAGSETKPFPSGFVLLWPADSPYDTSGYDFSGINAGTILPTERWACWELEYRARDELTFYLDDQLLPDFHIKRAPINPDYDVPLWFGMVMTLNDPFVHPDGYNVWIDEIAVSNKRIGCTL